MKNTSFLEEMVLVSKTGIETEKLAGALVKIMAKSSEV